MSIETVHNEVQPISERHKERLEIIEEVARLSENQEAAVHLSQDEIGVFKRDIEELPEFQKYQKQRITVDTFDEIAGQVHSKAEGEGGEEEKKILKNIDIFVRNIKLDIGNYYQAIMSIEHVTRSVASFHLSPEAMQKNIETKDGHRRLMHNALLADLTAFTRYCMTKVPAVLDVSIDTKLLFSSEELKNREFIGEWAFDTEIGHRIDQIYAYLEKTHAENKTRSDIAV